MRNKWMLIVYLLLTPVCAFAANLWALVITDTFNSDIGLSVVNDRERVYTEIEKIAYYTKLKVKKAYLTGSEVTPQHVLKKLQEIKPNKDDVLLFYFSGHGYRSKAKFETDPWPNLYFFLTHQGLDFTKVLDQLNHKSARLTIALADACNSFATGGYEPHLIKQRHSAEEMIPHLNKKNYRHLFLKEKGTIIATSSVPGSYSMSLPSGSLFTKEFFHGLANTIESTEDPNWNGIFDLSAAKLDQIQTPYWEVSLK